MLRSIASIVKTSQWDADTLLAITGLRFRVADDLVLPSYALR